MESRNGSPHPHHVVTQAQVRERLALGSHYSQPFCIIFASLKVVTTDSSRYSLLDIFATFVQACYSQPWTVLVSMLFIC
jgi:hypothetical protein